MGHSPPERTQARQQNGWFAATHWSVVLAAGHADSQGRRAALEMLCRQYWEPLYAYLRHLGNTPQDAEDLTQGFLAHLISQDRLQGVTPERGKFRTFLLASLKNFVADARDRAGAAKRGGGQTLLPLDLIAAESHFDRAASVGGRPEIQFDRQWAMALMNRAFIRLQQEYLAGSKAGQFAELAVFLAAEGSAGDYDTVAAKLDLSRGAVAVAVHRLRHRYNELIRVEVAHTVTNAAELDEEMHYLLEVLCR